MASDRLVRYIVTVNTDGALVGMERLSKKTDETANAMERSGARMKSLGSSAVSLGRSLTYISLPLAALGAYSVKSALQFESSMTLLRTQVHLSSKEVAHLNREVMGIGRTGHGFGPNELAEALYPITSDGFKAANAMKVLDAASAGARVSGASLTLTANALGGALRTYGVSGPEAAAKAMDSLNATVGFGKFKLEELDEALTSGFLVQAKRSGIGLNEVGDALDALARKSVPPQVEATRLQKTFIQFGTVTGIARKELSKIGISQLQLAEDMKNHGLIYALEDLQSHLGKLSSAEQNVVLGEAFGRSKGSANVGALLEALPEMKKIQKEREHYGTLQQALAVKEKTAQYQIDIAVAELKKTLIGLGQVLIPVVIPMLTKMAKVIGEVAQWFQKLPTPVREAATYFGIFLVAAGPLLIFFGNLLKAGGLVLTFFGGLGPAADGAAAKLGGETAAFTLAGTRIGEAFSLAFEAALPVAALTAILAILNKIHPSAKHGGEAEGHGWKGARKGNKSLLGLAASVNPFSPSGVIGEAGLSPSEEKAQLQDFYRKNIRPGVSSPSLYEAAGLTPHAATTAPEQFVSHIHIELEGKQLAEVTGKFYRDHPQSKAGKWHAEAVHKTVSTIGARG